MTQESWTLYRAPEIVYLETPLVFSPSFRPGSTWTPNPAIAAAIPPDDCPVWVHGSIMESPAIPRVSAVSFRLPRDYGELGFCSCPPAYWGQSLRLRRRRSSPKAPSRPSRKAGLAGSVPVPTMQPPPVVAAVVWVPVEFVPPPGATGEGGVVVVVPLLGTPASAAAAPVSVDCTVPVPWGSPTVRGL